MLIDNPTVVLQMIFPGGSPSAAYGFSLGVARLVGLFAALPLMTRRLLPVRFRLALAALVLFAVGAGTSGWTEFWERSASWVDGAPLGLVGWLLACGVEVVVGLTLGWSIIVVFGAVRAAAQFLSEQIGFSIGGVMDPYTDTSMTALQGFYGILTAFLFVMLDLHHALVGLGLDSIVRLPPGKIFGEGGDLIALGGLLLHTAGGVFQIALTLALPVTAVLFIAALAQGILSRALPEIELFALGFPVRVLVGVVVLALTLPFTMERLGGVLEGAFEVGETWMRSLAG